MINMDLFQLQLQANEVINILRLNDAYNGKESGKVQVKMPSRARPV